jgi:hypothetical protein
MAPDLMLNNAVPAFPALNLSKLVPEDGMNVMTRLSQYSIVIGIEI